MIIATLAARVCVPAIKRYSHTNHILRPEISGTYRINQVSLKNFDIWPSYNQAEKIFGNSRDYYLSIGDEKS